MNCSAHRRIALHTAASSVQQYHTYSAIVNVKTAVGSGDTVGDRC